jgi:hypothetical protein
MDMMGLAARFADRSSGGPANLADKTLTRGGVDAHGRTNLGRSAHRFSQQHIAPGIDKSGAGGVVAPVFQAQKQGVGYLAQTVRIRTIGQRNYSAHCCTLPRKYSTPYAAGLFLL